MFLRSASSEKMRKGLDICILVECVEDGLSTRGYSLLQCTSQFSAQMHWDQVLGVFLFTL